MSLSIKELNSMISDIRNCKNKDEEVAYIEDNKKKINEKLVSKKDLDDNKIKIYIWKLIYFKLLGYEIEFKENEIRTLLKSSNWSIKYTGYISLTTIVDQDIDDFFSSITTVIINDLYNSNENIQSLAINFIGTLAHKEVCVSLAPEITKLALGENTKITEYIRKKCLLTLLRMYRRWKEKFPPTNNWPKSLVFLLKNNNFKTSLLLPILSLIEGIISYNYDSNWNMCTLPIVQILYKWVIKRDCESEYIYYNIPAPWVQVKALKILTQLGIPNDIKVKDIIGEILKVILDNISEKVNKNENNCQYSILFSAIELVIHYRTFIRHDLQNQALSLVVVFMDLNDINLKYLALDTMSKILVLPDSESSLDENIKQIITTIYSHDISLKRRALDLLYLMCNNNNVGSIIEELLNFSEETDLQLKEELILKISILAEKFAPSLDWYIDVILRLLSKSGDFITNDIWYRLIQIIKGFGNDENEYLQKYAAQAIYNILTLPHVHQNLIKVAANILSEYSELLIDDEITSWKLFENLNKHINECDEETIGILLTSYSKLAEKYPELREIIINKLNSYHDHWDIEIQKRSLEYSQLLEMIEANNPDEQNFLNNLYKKLPTFPEEIFDQNPLYKKIINLKQKDIGNDNTIKNENLKLLEAQKNILKNRMNKININDLGKEDLFLDEESIFIKFSDSELFPMCKDRIATVGENLMLTPNNINLPKYGAKNIKQTLMVDNGIIYEDNDMKIDYKSSFNGPQGKIAIKFVSKSGQINIKKINPISHEGIYIKMSPVKMLKDPQIMINIHSVGYVYNLPVIKMVYYQNAQEKTLNISLPIFTNKFISKIKMEYEKFSNIYNNFTNSHDKNIFKLDEFIINPGNENTNIQEALKNLGIICSNGLNMSINPYPDLENLKKIWGTAQYQYIANEKNVINIPIMIEIEAYPENTKYLRLSLRTGGSALVTTAVYQMIMLYIS